MLWSPWQGCDVETLGAALEVLAVMVLDEYPGKSLREIAATWSCASRDQLDALSEVDRQLLANRSSA